MSNLSFQVILEGMRVRKSLLILIFLVSSLFFSCETLLGVLGSSGGGGGSSSPFTNAEAVEAMKSALNIGAENSSEELSQVDAYYGNPLLKIPLPDEAEKVRDFINKLKSSGNFGNLVSDFSDKLFENVIESVNRSAENAAKEVVPIFSEAITSMTVRDGIGIVTGEDDAATVYLKDKTYSQLMALYQPKMDKVLGTDLIGSVSANDAWTSLTSKYNNIHNTIMGNSITKGLVEELNISIPARINTDLSEYVTGKALDGVFVKVAEEEAKIRENPLDYASEIVRKVFGAVKAGLGL